MVARRSRRRSPLLATPRSIRCRRVSRFRLFLGIGALSCDALPTAAFIVDSPADWGLPAPARDRYRSSTACGSPADWGLPAPRLQAWVLADDCGSPADWGLPAPVSTRDPATLSCGSPADWGLPAPRALAPPGVIGLWLTGRLGTPRTSWCRRFTGTPPRTGTHYCVVHGTYVASTSFFRLPPTAGDGCFCLCSQIQRGIQVPIRVEPAIVTHKFSFAECDLLLSFDTARRARLR